MMDRWRMPNACRMYVCASAPQSTPPLRKRYDECSLSTSQPFQRDSDYLSTPHSSRLSKSLAAKDHLQNGWNLSWQGLNCPYRGKQGLAANWRGFVPRGAQFQNEDVVLSLLFSTQVGDQLEANHVDHLHHHCFCARRSPDSSLETHPLHAVT